MSGKRRRSAFEDADQPRLEIRLAGGQTLSAPAKLVRFFSGVADSLPPSAEAWDLIGLQVEGEPPSLETAQAWLAACERHGLTGPAPAGDESAPASTLVRLLAFADAVDSTPAVLHACVGDLPALVLDVPWQQGSAVELATDGRCYWWQEQGPEDAAAHAVQGEQQAATHSLRWDTVTDKREAVECLECLSGAQREAFSKAAAASLEPLLHLAYRLELKPLQERLRAFIEGNRQWDNSLLHGLDAAVFSDRVLDAAALDKEQMRQAWAPAAAHQAYRLLGVRRHTGQGATPLFELEDGQELPEPVRFKAKLATPLFGMPAGTAVVVGVDMFRASAVNINGWPFFCSLRLGKV